MSLNKSATRRLSLLAGSSLMAAGLTACVFAGAAFAPTSAHAYDECVPTNPPTTLTDGENNASDPGLNGATADSFTCSATTYATGISYTPDGALTVTKTNTTLTTITANGVNLTGAGGANAITWNSSAGGVTGGAGTAGPVIHVTSGSGPISITTGAVTGTQAGTTHAIQAVSDGGGNITITRASGTVNNSVAGGQAAIAATTNGGNISITTGGSTSGRARGILAQTSGAGSVTLIIAGATNTQDVAAIDATAGTGGLSITINSGVINGNAGKAIVATSTGGAVVNNVNGQIGFIPGAPIPVTGSAVDFSGVTGGGVTFNNVGQSAGGGRWIASGTSVFSGGNDVLGMAGIGENVLFDGASINFAGGADTFNLSGRLGALAGTLDFGTGVDTFNLSGILAVNGPTISNLEVFNNSGVILMGTSVVRSGNFINVDYTQTNGLIGDVLAAPGVTFTGSGAGRIVMDVLLGAEQAGCDTPTAADCLDLRGSSTAGVTLLTVNYVGTAAQQGAFRPIALVEVGGAGTSAASHFVLDPNSDGYLVDPTFGGVLERPGLFRYGLRYDPGAQQHVLVGLPRSEIMEYAVLSGVAQSIWHMTSETVTDRQTDLRAGTEGGSLWMRASGEYSKRDVTTGFDLYGQTDTFDNSYKLYAGTIMGGMDFIVGESGGYDYVVGGQLGYVSSSLELQASPSRGRFTGGTGGVYASVWSERAFFDAAVNANVLTLDYSSSGLAAKTNTYLNAVGGHAEGGLRLPISEGAFVEPLASLAYVRTSFEEISLVGGEIAPADSESLRGALGLRFGATLTGQTVSASYFVTGRAWNEFEGESGGVVVNAGADLPYADEFTGGFGEAEAGISVYNATNTLSGFATTGVKWKDGYSAVNLSLGVRMAW